MDVSAYMSRGAKAGCRGILNSSPTKSFGVTLLELISYVAVSSIIATVGVLSLQGIIATNRSSTQINDLIATVNLTR